MSLEQEPENTGDNDSRLDGGAEDGLDERAKPVYDETGHKQTDTEVNSEGETRVDLYNANHGKSARTGGPYLDDVQAEEAEIRRAKVEDREPDLDNPPAAVGTVLVPKSQLVERDTDKSHYSDRVEVENEPVDSYVVPKENTEPDPTQADWDNDTSKIAALEGAKRYEELTGQKNSESNTTGETQVNPAEPSQSVHTDNQTPVEANNNAGGGAVDNDTDAPKSGEGVGDTTITTGSDGFTDADRKETWEV